jgi:ribose/xylose/arabinose/galactoside ABC-type transport system permease subunit
MKPGIKTSEFIIAVLAMVLPPLVGWAVSAFGGNPIVASIIGILTTIVSIAYIVMRGLLKLEAAKATDVLTPEAEDTIRRLMDVIAAILPKVKDLTTEDQQKILNTLTSVVKPDDPA